jgi:hypothetical protein
VGEDKEQGGPAVGTAPLKAGQAKINSDKLCWGGATLEELEIIRPARSAPLKAGQAKINYFTRLSSE